MGKKNILFNMYTLEIGGAEKSLISILNTIDYEKYNVDLFLYKHSGDLLKQIPKEVNLLPEIEIYRTLCESTKVTFKRGYVKLGIVRSASKYIGKFRKLPLAYDQYMNKMAKNILPKLEKEYDVAISNIWPHDLVVNKVKANKKIGWIHTDYTKMKIDYLKDRDILSKLDNIVFVSEQCKEAFETIHPMLKDKSIYIENIVSDNLIKGLSEKNVEEEDLFQGDSIKLLTVGRLHSDKGIDRAVEACKKIIDDGLDIRWFVIGYGPQEEEIKKRIKELGIGKKFYLLDKKINPYPYFKKCDIYVQPSRFEGKAIAITEAKIFNKPIVITDYTSARDQIDNMITGLVVENTIDGIYKGVKKIIKSDTLRYRIATNLSNKIWSNIEDIENIYSLIEGGVKS